MPGRKRRLKTKRLGAIKYDILRFGWQVLKRCIHGATHDNKYLTQQGRKV